MQTKIYFFLTKTTLRRKFFPMTKAGREFFNRRSKQTVSGKGSDWCDFTCNFCFFKMGKRTLLVFSDWHANKYHGLYQGKGPCHFSLLARTSASTSKDCI